MMKPLRLQTWKRRGTGPQGRRPAPMPPSALRLIAWAALVLATAPVEVAAQAPQEAAAPPEQVELAKKLANPIASLISVPLQFNFDRKLGPDDDGERYLLNVQPVIPIKLSPEWNVISRTILPITGLDGATPDGGSQFGLGDTTQSFFFSPEAPGPGGLIWGVGPAFLVPTGTDDVLGTGKWAAGPTGVALIQEGPWTVGILANHLWSFAGDGDRAYVNKTYLQPFVNYTWPTATSLGLNLEDSYDWRTNEASPVFNLAAGQMFKVGTQIMQLQAGLRYWLDTPEGGPEGFGARVQLTFLFPR